MAGIVGAAVSTPRNSGLRLNGRSWGTDRAPRLVLVHGFGCSARWWDQTGRLMQRGYSVLSVDLLGHGDSPRSSFGYSFGVQAEALINTLEAYGVTNAILVGHSMGGHICVEAALRAPERVAGLTAVNTPPQLPVGGVGILGRLALLPGIGPIARMTAPPFVTRRAMAGLFGPGFVAPKELLGDARRVAPDAYASSWRALLEYMEGYAPVGAHFAKVDTKKLVIWGELDRMWPHAAGRHLAELAGSEFVTIAGVGHSPQVEAPERVATTIARFADSVYGAVAA